MATRHIIEASVKSFEQKLLSVSLLRVGDGEEVSRIQRTRGETWWHLRGSECDGTTRLGIQDLYCIYG